MKIGIMSMQRVVNYGSFLQSYALKKTIEEMGHEVEFVDFHIEPPLLDSKIEKNNYRKELIKNKIIEVISKNSLLIKILPKDKKEIIENRRNYNTKFLPMLGVSSKFKYNTKLDALIIGSDEVFNLFQKSARVGFSLELYGKNNQAKKLISYAASFGNTTIKKIEKSGKKEEIANLLGKFDAISVRDSNSGNIIKTLTDKEPTYNLDPVLIYDFRDEVPEIKLNDQYIIVYAYRNRLTQEEKYAIKEFAKKKNRKLIALGGYQDFVDEYINANPFELLSYVRNADYVITDTFHGAIFSIISHRKFVSFVRKSKDGSYGNQEKMEDLLKRLNLTSRAIYNPNEIEEKIEKEIDYEEVEKIRNEYINRTKEYLKKHLN